MLVEVWRRLAIERLTQSFSDDVAVAAFLAASHASSRSYRPAGKRTRMLSRNRVVPMWV